MKNPFQKGDKKYFERHVTEAHIAKFDTGVVHPLYSTFAIAQDMEWVCRLFVLEMLENGEEGIGTQLSIEHISPCLLGEVALHTATLEYVEGNTVFCSVEVKVGERLIAKGTQTQKIIDKARFNQKLQQIQSATKKV
ncbi:MAG: hypothetical protein NZ519_08605 [Bacteroidia bacterium]|nr:hypothetical protein [Bacteroidia bacterium]MDW8301523.1 hypothetical protein [Bacteroidia bacterium]